MSRALPLLPLWAVRPVQSLSACTRVHFTFTLLTKQYSEGKFSLFPQNCSNSCNTLPSGLEEALLEVNHAILIFITNWVAFLTVRPASYTKNEMTRCITNISEQNCALPGYYAVTSGNSLTIFRDNLSCWVKNPNTFGFLTPEYVTERLSPNVGNKLALFAA
jgi:hypothetical protein